MTLWRFSRILIPPLLGFVVLALFWLLASLVQSHADERLRDNQRGMLGELRGKLEGELNASLNLTAGLVAYVRVHGGISQQTFESIADSMLQKRTLVRNITLAPDNVIRYVHPLEGNEAVLGQNLLDHDTQGAVTRLALERGQAVLAGPLELIQGGYGLIHRVPIYLRHRHRSNGPDGYWGLMSVPMDYTRLVTESGLEKLSRQMDLAIRTGDGPDVGDAVFFGDARLFARPDSLLSQVKVLDETWVIAAAPLRDRGANTRWTVGLLQAVGVVMGALLGFLAWRTGRQAKRLENSERLYRELTEQMQDVVFQTDTERRLTYLSPAWSRLTGFAVEGFLGKDWIALLDPRDHARAQGHHEALFRQQGTGEGYLEELRVPRKQGEPLWMVVRANASRDASGRLVGIIGTMVDITVRKQAEEHAHYLAMHDNLTGLPNRLLLQDRFTHALARLQRQNREAERNPLARKAGLAFLFLDLDGFKVINDRYGHETGDRVLKIAARRFQAQLREMDTLARLGGDEFAVLLDCQGEGSAAVQVAEKLIEVISEPIEIEGKTCRLGVSIGISFLPLHGSTLDELITHADNAMYEAKNAGKGCWRMA
jgi:diguanylate cyclase (GGDEF)-like protein/PAS domain S-box-containing protein